MDYQLLIKKAFEAREAAYAPYSNFKVGAALLCAGGRIYQGCNIESVSLTPTVCAERTAFFKAVSEGVMEFTAIAVVGAGGGEENIDYCAPCGVCRQVMAEFCIPDDFLIIIAKSESDYIVKTLGELLPMSFGPERLNKQ